MLCKEIGRPGMQPSFRQEDARIFTGYMEMGAKGSSSQMSPSALPRSLRMRLPSKIRPGRGDGWGGVLSSPALIAVCHAWVFHTTSLFFQSHVGPVMGDGGNGDLGSGPHGGGRPGMAVVGSCPTGRARALVCTQGEALPGGQGEEGMEQNLWDTSVSISKGMCPSRVWEHISGAWAQLLSTAENSFFLAVVCLELCASIPGDRS